MVRGIALSLVGVSIAATLWGCGGPGYPSVRLEGAVTVDGQPVEAGTISFTPLQPGRGAGVSATIAAGRYAAGNVPQGKVRVDFQATKETGRTVEQFGKPYPETVNVIPERCAAGMEIEVGTGDAKRDFNLTTK